MMTGKAVFVKKPGENIIQCLKWAGLMMFKQVPKNKIENLYEACV